ncbi:glycosyltransferase family 1 protein [Salidesulfovibrio onnuriiensis]|uniref:glycosyltransferase family 1 protein n=1 Tax=Salidesulfovibrio onnuriiensis TaxID=2583823 RepID=UPI0032B7B477
MKTCIFLPPVRKPTGGVTVLRQIADILHQSGREACLVARDRSGWRPEGLADAAPVLDWEKLDLSPEDIWLVPEGWVNALAPGLEARARCYSYVQNWAYLFSSLPPGVTWAQLPASFLSVSAPVAHFVREATGRDSLVLRPGIDRSIFQAPEAKPGGKPRIAFMPRKNKALAAQIRAVFENRNGPDRARWLEVEGLDTFGVAEALRSSHIFLMTGFPEGCPLPPWRPWPAAACPWASPAWAAGTICARPRKTRAFRPGGRCARFRGPATGCGARTATCWTRPCAWNRPWAGWNRARLNMPTPWRPGSGQPTPTPRHSNGKMS